MADRPILILVHGTFAPGSKWTLSGSTLREEVRPALPPGTRVLRFNWSGRNSHWARQSAGRDFREFVERMSKRRHGRRRVIICAHSHGGTIVHYGLGALDQGDSVAAVACLGTPFLEAKGRRPFLLLAAPLILAAFWLWDKLGYHFLRDPSKWSSGLLVFVALSWATSSSIVRLACLVGFVLTVLNHDPVGLSVIAGCLAFLAVAGRIAWNLSGSIQDLWYERAESLTSRYVTGPPLFVAQAARDEARLWLRGLSFLSRLPNLLWDWRVLALHYVGWVVLGLTLLPDTVQEATSIMRSTGSPGFTYPSWFPIAATLVASCILTAVTTVTASLLLIPIIVGLHMATRDTPLGYGFSWPIVNTLLDLRVTELPDISVFHDVPRSVVCTYRMPARALQHSALYADPRVLHDLAQFFSVNTRPAHTTATSYGDETSPESWQADQVDENPGFEVPRLV